MDAEELDREWSAWLEDRKRPAPPDPEFTRRVMESIRAQADRSQALAAGRPPAAALWVFRFGPGRAFYYFSRPIVPSR